MLRSIAITVALSLALAAQANDGSDLSLRNKALASAGSTAKSDAPLASGRDPLPRLLLLEERERSATRRGTCEFSATDLCYDLADGRVVYRPARDYLPRVPGLTPENISVRRNRVVFKYSFR